MHKPPVPRNIQETSEDRTQNILVTDMIQKVSKLMALVRSCGWKDELVRNLQADAIMQQATCPEKHPRNIRRQNAKHTLYRLASESINIYGSREVLWLKRELMRATCPKRHPRNIRRQNAKHTLTDMIQKVSKSIAKFQGKHPRTGHFKVLNFAPRTTEGPPELSSKWCQGY